MQEHPVTENGHMLANGDHVPDFDAAGDFEGEGDPEMEVAVAPDVEHVAGVEADATADAELEQEKDTPARALYFVRIPRPTIDDTAVKRAQDDFTAALTKLKKINVKLQSKRVVVQELRKQKAMGRSLKDGSREEYEQKLAQLREMSDVRKTYSSKISGIKGTIAGLDVRSEEELDTRIKELEARIAGGELSLRDEKDVVRQIARLNQQRPRVKEYGNQSESLAELQNENTKVRATISEVESEFHILKSEREQAQKIIADIQGKLVVAEKELKDVEEEQQDLVRAKNEAAEAIQAARQKNDLVTGDWRDNRRMSAQVRDMVESGHIDEARALCEQQVEVWLGRIFTDTAFRKQYTGQWAAQRKYAVAEVLPNSATSPEAVAALKAVAAREAKAKVAANKASKGPVQPVLTGAEKAKALIAACLQEASLEVAQRREGLLRPARHASDDEAEEEEEEDVPVPAPAAKKASAVAAKPAASAAGAVKIAAFTPAVELPDLTEKEPFVVPVVSSAGAEAPVETEEQIKARIREEQRAKAAEAEDRKRRKIEAAEKKRLQAVDAKKRAEEVARAAKLAAPPAPALAPEPVVSEAVEEEAPAAAQPAARSSSSVAKPKFDSVLASQKVVAAKRPKKAPAKWASAQATSWAQENVVGISAGILAVLFLVIAWVVYRLMTV